MKVFGFPTSPYVRKVLLIAAEKGVEVELIPATPHKPTPEFLAASPFKMMPAMVDGAYSLPDSTAIFMYLDAKYPEPALMPFDPEGRGKAMWFDEFADTVLANSARTIGFNRYIGPALLGLPKNEEAAAEAEKSAAPALDWLEEQLPESGWLVGEAFSLADLAVASCLKTMAYGLDIAARPKTGAWFSRIAQRPAWQQVATQESEMVQAAASSGEHRKS